MSALSAAASPADTEEVPAGREVRVLTLASVYYLLAAVAVMLLLWRHPTSGTVAGNPNDADQFSWFFRYDAAAIAHGRLPALVTTALNAPQGLNVMWNTFMLLPGVLLAPVTLLAGPQVSLNVLMTVGFAGSAVAMFAVLRRWDVSVTGAAIAGAVYGFSPALIQSAIGHYDLQFAVLPPLIIDAALRIGTGRARPVRGGLWLGFLTTVQLLTAEELLVDTALGGVVIAAVLVASRPREALRRAGGMVAGFAVAAAVTLVVCAYPLWVQFLGPLHQHGSAFTPDFFKNDLTGLVAPSGLMLLHSASSAATAAHFQGGAPEYLAYVGWPLLIVLAAVAVAFWRHLAVRVTAVTFAVLEVLSLGGTLMTSGTHHSSVLLPWHWLGSVPLLGAALPDRFSIIADGAAAVLLAFGIDLARRVPRIEAARWGARLVTGVAILAVLPLVPKPLPVAAAVPVPSGWAASFAALHLPAGARVLIVPIPTATFTEPMRWQADTGQPGEMIGGYFTGPGPGGQAYIDGGVMSPVSLFLNVAWAGQPSLETPARAQVQAQLATWHPAAVVAVTSVRSDIGTYLRSLLGKPAYQSQKVVAWRM
ncbi:MAG TPA: hypothetical protein VGN41_05435 [Streptosporangiaceae bacterium]